MSPECSYQDRRKYGKGGGFIKKINNEENKNENNTVDEKAKHGSMTIPVESEDTYYTNQGSEVYFETEKLRDNNSMNKYSSYESDYGDQEDYIVENNNILPNIKSVSLNSNFFYLFTLHLELAILSSFEAMAYWAQNSII